MTSQNINVLEVLGHEHPLKLIDLELERPHNDEEKEDEEEEEEEDSLFVKEEFRCICGRCDQDISEYHRYYYKCIKSSCDYSLHKFCAEALETLEPTSHHPDHPLKLIIKNWWYDGSNKCSVCRSGVKYNEVIYMCSRLCYESKVHIKCALGAIEKELYHPSHPHALVCITPKPILCDCNACGKEHKGIFYSCIVRSSFILHSDCAFLTKKLLIQEATEKDFYHPHPLTLSYSFPRKDQIKYSFPPCRVCGLGLSDDYNLWIYKCEKCRYFVHLDCATSRREPFMSIVSSPGLGKLVKNYKDSDHPDLLHLPFLDQSYSIPKLLLHKQIGSKIVGSDTGSLKHDSHEHPLILVKNDDNTSSTSSKIYSISCHDPMKRVELLCNGCLRPITSTPFYKCANKEQQQHCNFVLHECCIECEFITDVSCGLLPDKITHDAHPNHLLSRVTPEKGYKICKKCGLPVWRSSFSCNICDFHLHPACAYLFPRSIRHRIDKHPLDLNYVPVENHKSDYFCEICETELNPQTWFYHCHECAQSVHTACVSVILQYEKATGVNPYLNIKFEGTHTLECHPHPLSFVQGIMSDGHCAECRRFLMNQMIFKCGLCNYAVHYTCCERLSHSSEIPPT
ncbi:uncharacterized protein [Rutidosis leptorrhynchoides]|uniref:uncharacterized protein n=1 Tax=Rutidosis leptorrhynchoides TaxID=125765 RepID=UPI003A992671